jgi:hypothetical protein
VRRGGIEGYGYICIQEEEKEKKKRGKGSTQFLHQPPDPKSEKPPYLPTVD